MIKSILCAVMLTAGWQQARGFALLGPAPGTAAGDLSVALPGDFGDAWQVAAIGYDIGYFDGILPGDPVWLGDLGGPKNFDEGYRRNDPVLYYACDENFSGFFGAQGEAAIDQAFGIMNNVFTNYADGVDGYSANLTEFPFDSTSPNATATALFLTDLKSVTLHLLVEQMGLAEPERFTWTLEDRFLPPGGKCPLSEEYLVIQRNYATTDQPLNGPETGTLYSPYVDNVLYSYGIADDCGTLPTGSSIKWTAITEPFSVNPDEREFVSVAANDDEGLELQDSIPGGGLESGEFYTGLTEDDVAGLRYLMTSNNIQFEIPAAGTEMQATNTTSLQLLTTSDLGALLQFALTNGPVALQAQFPGIEIGSVSNFFVVVTNPIIVSYFTNYIGEQNGSGTHQVIFTNGFTYTPQEEWAYTFANVITNSYSSNTVAQLQTITLEPMVGAQAPAPLVTNVTTTTIILTNVPSGDYYLVPPGTCGFEISQTLIANNFAGATTNVIVTATNSTGFVGSESIVTFFTNNTFEVYPCALQAPTPSYYQGIEHVQFIRVADSDVDPLTEAFYIPITNSYSMVQWNPTNGQLSTQVFQRIVTAPDFLFTASPNASGPGGLPFVGSVVRDIHFEDGQIHPGLSGPGVIDGETTFNYNDIGTIWWNGDFADTNSFLPGNESEVNQTTQVPGLLWASYDGTTNTPIVYPNNLSIQEMENQMVITISPSTLPAGTNGVPYTPTAFTATGGTPPYSFSVASGATLPPGMALFGSLGSYYLEGTPSTNGIFDTTIQLTDSSTPAKVVTFAYTITIY